MSKRRYGDKFGKVILLTSEFEDLAEKFPNHYIDYINRLDDYIYRTGRQYLSHYTTIKEWLTRDGIKEEEKVLTLGEIFINYDGNNRAEIIKLRKQWNPICPYCKNKMVFHEFLEKTFEKGKTPTSIVKCTGCKMYGVGEVYIQDNERKLGQGYSDDPSIWHKDWDEMFKELFGELNGNKNK